MTRNKGILSDEEKAVMIAITRGVAHDLLDDLDYIRVIIKKEHLVPGDIRRLSNQLRRILIDGDLAKVASP